MVGRNIPTIPETFNGKNLFITGGTGFIGKIFIEKLLRSCPDVKTLYVLIRPKKNNTVEERVEKLKKDVLFNLLKETNPDALDKLIPISGDVNEIGFGISEADKATLIKNVTIVVHNAASVRFDDHLKDAIITNVRSTRECIKLAEELNKVEAFVHVSTAYSNCEKRYVEEKFYAPKWDWRTAIEMAENNNEEFQETLNKLTLKVIEPMPNTYVFSKGIAEQVVRELCPNKFPTCIIRPSVVLPTIQEPVEGYVDNLNGPVGLFYAGGAGILRVLHVDSENLNDNCYCDNVGKAIIASIWRLITENNCSKATDEDEIRIYNVASDLIYKSIDSCGYAIQSNLVHPMKYYIAPPEIAMIESDTLYYIYNILFHLIPALIIDVLLKLAGQKISILKFRKKVVLANKYTLPFLRPGTPWKFNVQNYEDLGNMIPESDKKAFSFLENRVVDPKDRRVKDIIQMYTKKTKKFLSHFETDDDKTQDAIRLKRFTVIYKLVVYGFYFFLFYFFVLRRNLHREWASKAVDYYVNL